ncbi:hypothetical protein LOZ65_004490 [Ophidiomyces ophidiicola]|nr:hypothetical protein LOZ65_004490 [Ophidiomyces ophidiicola]
MPTTERADSQMSSSRRRRHRRERQETENDQDRHRRHKSRASDDEGRRHKHRRSKSQPEPQSAAENSAPRSRRHEDDEPRHKRSSTATHRGRSRVSSPSPPSKCKARRTATSSPAPARRKSSPPPTRTRTKVPLVVRTLSAHHHGAMPKKHPKESPESPAIEAAQKRTPSFFSWGALFRSPPPPPPPPPEKKVSCLICMSDDIPVSRSAKLACSHRMCYKCLKRAFTLSLTDPQHMPPRCCTTDPIPVKYVDRLFDARFKATWNKKFHEYSTKNRIYCPARGCGEWIPPKHIHQDTSYGAHHGRKYGKCTKCKTKVCVLCNGKWHLTKDCPKDDDAKAFTEMAKEAGWQRCFNCSAMVELKEGCNHMTCRCTAEFCIICGSRWKTCDCPWFNYQNPGQEDGHNFAYDHHPGMPYPDHRGMPQPRGYQQEMDMRNEQEQADEYHAQRLQENHGRYDYDYDDLDDDAADYHRQGTPTFAGDPFPPIYDNFVLPRRFVRPHTPPPPINRHVRQIYPLPRQVTEIRPLSPDYATRRRRRMYSTTGMPLHTPRAEEYRIGVSWFGR